MLELSPKLVVDGAAETVARSIVSVQADVFGVVGPVVWRVRARIAAIAASRIAWP